MKIDFQNRELVIKLVYYGPALSGKTTNIAALHELILPTSKGDLITLPTKDDRTLFFDFFPLEVSAKGALKFKIKLFTVPGQVIHNATRRMVLQGADGVAFIADSQISMLKENASSFINLKQNLEYNKLDIKELPLVIQYNKRDLPNIRSDEEIDRLAKLGKEPVYKAIAIRKIGVIETFIGLVELTLTHLNNKHQLDKKFGINVEELLEKIILSIRKTE